MYPFNPFWDASKHLMYQAHRHREHLSIPFGMLLKVGDQIARLLRLNFQSLLGCFDFQLFSLLQVPDMTFNPFWDASLVKGKRYNLHIWNIFQSLLGCFIAYAFSCKGITPFLSIPFGMFHIIR